LQRTPKKQIKHLEQTLTTYVYSHCNICNIPIYFCNIHIKQLQHTSETSETFKTYACNLRFQQKAGRRVAERGRGASGQDGSHDRGSATSTPRGGVSVRRPNETDTRDLSLSFFYPSSVPLKEIRAFIFFLSIEIEILKQKSPLSRVQATF
jgi:hypothetical protein